MYDHFILFTCSTFCNYDNFRLLYKRTFSVCLHSSFSISSTSIDNDNFTRKERTTNNQIKILIEDIENVKSILSQFDIDIKNTNQIEKLHIRLNNRLNEYKAKAEKKRNNIFKVFQISIIPIFLAVFNQFIENSFDIDKILSFCLIYIFMIAIFAFVIYAISETYFDMTSKYYRNMEKFLSLLKDIEEYDTETLNKISALTC